MSEILTCSRLIKTVSVAIGGPTAVVVPIGPIPGGKPFPPKRCCCCSCCCLVAFQNCFCAEYRFIGHIMNKQSDDEKKLKNQ